MTTKQQGESYGEARAREKREAKDWWGKPIKVGSIATGDLGIHYERVERIETVSPSGSMTREQITFRATRLDRKGLEAFSGYGRSYIGCTYGYRTDYMDAQAQGVWKPLAPNHDTSVALSLEGAYDNVRRWLHQRKEFALARRNAEQAATDLRALVASLGGLGMAREHLSVRQRDLSEAAHAVSLAESKLREARDVYAACATSHDDLARAIFLVESESKDGAK